MRKQILFMRKQWISMRLSRMAAGFLLFLRALQKEWLSLYWLCEQRLRVHWSNPSLDFGGMPNACHGLVAFNLSTRFYASSSPQHRGYSEIGLIWKKRPMNHHWRIRTPVHLAWASSLFDFLENRAISWVQLNQWK